MRLGAGAAVGVEAFARVARSWAGAHAAGRTPKAVPDECSRDPAVHEWTGEFERFWRQTLRRVKEQAEAETTAAGNKVDDVTS
jgi:hypothetical protein